MYRNRKRRYKTVRSIPEITMTPLIDTALTLLVIFMITTPMIQKSFKIDLPKGQVKEDKGNPDLNVFIDKEGTINFNGKACANSEELLKELNIHIGNGQNKTLCLNADTLLSYGTVAELIHGIKKSVQGISNVTLSARTA